MAGLLSRGTERETARPHREFLRRSVWSIARNKYESGREKTTQASGHCVLMPRRQERGTKKGNKMDLLAPVTPNARKTNQLRGELEPKPKLRSAHHDEPVRAIETAHLSPQPRVCVSTNKTTGKQGNSKREEQNQNKQPATQERGNF